MKIILDMHGGDNAPLEAIRGAIMATEKLGVSVIGVGDAKLIQKISIENNLDISKIEIVNAPKVMEIDFDATTILKQNNDTSMAVGLKMLKEEKGDAFVSGGSTAALVIGASFITKRIKGIKRVALASVIPSDNGQFVLLDCGANLECRAAVLLSFAQMASVYMQKVYGVASPKVGLINVGAEETKGTDEMVLTHNLLKKSDLNFIGNVEPRDLLVGTCDVAVSDGLVGNMVLKTIEGASKYLLGNVKKVLLSNFKTKIGALLIKKDFGALKKKLDYREHGGAPLLGVNYPVFKAHGSSDATAFYNAIRQAKIYCDNDCNAIMRQIAALTSKQETTQE